MKTTDPIDAARIELLLTELRLPAIKLMWNKFAEQSDKEGWPAARFLAALAEHEIADRGRRRIERHLAEARLPIGKTLANFELIGSRYERRSMLITANQPFGAWSKVSSRDHSRDERRELSTPRCPRSQTRSGTAAVSRDNQGKSLIVAPRQSNHCAYCLTQECSPERNCCLIENVPVASCCSRATD